MNTEDNNTFMIFTLDDLDLEYTNEKTQIVNNYKYICYSVENCNINNDLCNFKLPKQSDSSKRKTYILSDYIRNSKKIKLHHSLQV